MLTELGLADEEDAVYRTLVVHPGVRAADLARTLAATGAGGEAAPAAVRSEEEVAAVLRRLVSTGLALVDPGPGGEPRYRATPPALALEPLLTARRDGLRQAETLIARLTEQYREAQTEQPGAPVEVVTGREAVRHRFLQLQLAAQREVLGFMPVSRREAVVPVEENEAEAEAMRRGVRYRVVLERGWLGGPGARGLVEESLRAGQELTVVESVPLQMVIADGRTAMVGLSALPGSGDPGAVIIHETGLLEALVALFHAYRERGWRLVDPQQTGPAPGPDDGLDGEDRSILGLLYVGLTDVSIARQLGLGHRTVQRRLSRLMQLADAQTRFQLGCHAVRAGWLSGGAGPHETAPDVPAEDLAGL
ncbi:hypothetical protein AB0L71_10540 [Streptomyces sp. NPDC052052]|uniref:hypothetical protein n=1 Tax=Streptomyces sp. NPDC052052 TaxID=3154756 RepID=UPI003434BCA8